MQDRAEGNDGSGIVEKYENETFNPKLATTHGRSVMVEEVAHWRGVVKKVAGVA